MPITGVMPLPAVMNSRRSGSHSGSTKSPAGASICRRAPTRSSSLRWADTRPPAIALAVISMQPSSRSGAEAIE